MQPGGSLTLFWSIRNVPNAVIYKLDTDGQRELVYNIPPDGSETVTTSSRDRGQVEYLLVAGEGAQAVQQSVVVPLACPIAWFFAPPPEACPNGIATTSTLVVQDFERGRMVYVASQDVVYALFNDGSTPAWISFVNRFNPAVDPAFNEDFERSLIGTAFVQPRDELGFVWRGSDTVRTRLGNGIAPAVRFEGSVQSAPVSGGGDSLYLSGVDDTVLQLLPGGTVWQIITPSLNGG